MLKLRLISRTNPDRPGTFQYAIEQKRWFGWVPYHDPEIVDPKNVYDETGYFWYTSCEEANKDLIYFEEKYA